MCICECLSTPSVRHKSRIWPRRSQTPVMRSVFLSSGSTAVKLSPLTRRPRPTVGRELQGPTRIRPAAAANLLCQLPAERLVLEAGGVVQVVAVRLPGQQDAELHHLLLRGEGRRLHGDVVVQLRRETRSGLASRRERRESSGGGAACGLTGSSSSSWSTTAAPSSASPPAGSTW